MKSLNISNAFLFPQLLFLEEARWFYVHKVVIISVIYFGPGEIPKLGSLRLLRISKFKYYSVSRQVHSPFQTEFLCFWRETIQENL
jgi:hypothetical protein